MAGYIQSGQSEAIQLQNIANKKLIKNTDILLGRRGCQLINDTTDHDDIIWEAIVVREEGTQIAVLEGRDSRGNNVDLITEFGIDGVDLFTGEFIPAKNYPITRIQLTSGSVMMY